MATPTEKTQSLTRLENFSDAVIAVAITILVLDLKPAELSSAVRQNRFDYSFLYHQLPKFLAYFVSFLQVAAAWAALVSNYRRASRATSPLVWLTLLHLFCICLVPWATAVWSENPTLPQAVTVYCAVSTSVIATAALVQRRLAATFFPTDALAKFNSRVDLVAIAGYSVVTALSAFVTVYIALTAAWLFALLFVIPRPVLRDVFRPPRRVEEEEPSGIHGGGGAGV